ncbi:hypothetical protein PsW64_00687 [Pseudovibrio sp. W64]|uniref:hypothetical protein n=1 Tax=unclassified Pseudovibrio TaxID=2627060 RepID=UPI000710FC0A|nr:MULTISPECIES: hypothetical protein [unclassified Pseudovibrio]KZK87375.1 hypothetical protein PsAD13_00648 [Pseudovibrio sp. Ad13]KZK88980.1 hypothetical protein PsAD5_05335 [Pseudovibrio sp. Ad5]KZK89353.1 hypothetical protein PsW64_00687 [Pseudovibrio sp. W64]KZK95596.1 hypothetical protein PsAD46_00606 [Pseudovibrio sp. Ad46]KZL02765.1 hypothetical protein PsW74_01281 [Pseudovibrio sp. W74]
MKAPVMPKAGQCKWTEGDSGSYTFPCKNRAENGSYCDHHRTIVYETPEQRKARAEEMRAANAAANKKRLAA